MDVIAKKNTKVLIKGQTYTALNVQTHPRAQMSNTTFIKELNKHYSTANFLLPNGQEIPNSNYESPLYQEYISTKVMTPSSIEKGVIYTGNNIKIPKDKILEVEKFTPFNIPINERVDKIKIKIHDRFLNAHSNFRNVLSEDIKKSRDTKFNIVLAGLGDKKVEEELINDKKRKKNHEEKKLFFRALYKAYDHKLKYNKDVELFQLVKNIASDIDVKTLGKYFQVYNIHNN